MRLTAVSFRYELDFLAKGTLAHGAQTDLVVLFPLRRAHISFDLRRSVTGQQYPDCEYGSADIDTTGEPGAEAGRFFEHETGA
jgi:hypothetical protein